MATYYIDPNGVNDPGRDGSSGQPWATLSYACGRMSGQLHTIYANNGTYNDASRIVVPVGITITGQSESGVIYNCTYNSTSSSNAAFYYYSSTLTSGNQSLSYMTITGTSLTASRGIWVGYRQGVSIHHCTIKNFSATGVHFRNQIDWMTPPSTYASTNSFYYNTVTNCSDRNYAPIDPGNLRIDGQENMTIYNNIFRNNERSQGQNGNILNISFCRGIEIYNCDFTKPDSEGGEWNFFAEIFHLRGGVEIRDCNFYGAAKLDMGNAYNGSSTRGAYDYTISVHDCFFTTTTGNQISISGIGHTNAAIEFEKGIYNYVYIYNNHIKAFANGIKFSTSTNYDNDFSHIYIYNNKLENIGYTDYSYTWGILFSLENNGSYAVSFDNTHIRNNTIYGGSGYNYDAIRWVANGTLTNSSIKNNILHSWDQRPINFTICSGESASFTDVDVTYNNFYNNGINSIGIDESITQTRVNISTGNTTGDPLLVSSTDYHLSLSSSSAYHSGIAPTLSPTDYDGISWGTPPSMGCYEWVDEVTTYYVKTYATGGRDEAEKDGLSSANAWATPSYACGRVTAGDKIINIASGNYTDNNRAVLAPMVHIQGNSTSRPVITTNYVATSESDAYIVGYSSPLADGNQTISYLIIDGNSWTATRGIYIGYRHNVDIHHCEIRYFKTLGVHYKNEINWMTPPTTYASGSNFYNNVLISNSGDRDLGGNGADLRLDGQTEINVYNCDFYENIKPLGESGDTFTLSFVKGLKMYNCNFYRHDHEADQWNFYSEMFHLRGGVEIYDCNFYGSANLDFGNAYNGSSSRGTYDFTISVHDCYFTTTTGNQISTASLGHTPIAIQVEKGDMEYVYIYKNYIKGYASGFYITSSNDVNFNHFYIYSNIFEHLGSTDHNYTYGIAVLPEGTSSVSYDNIHFCNNVMYGGSGYNHTGIRWTAQGTLTNSSIKNNIFYGWDNYPVYFDIQSGRTFSMNNMSVTYNVFYGNGTDSVYMNEAISQTNVDITTAKITTDPQFNSVSPFDAHLQSTSPALGTGTVIGSPVLYDYAGVAWGTPPSRGAYEYVEGYIPINLANRVKYSIL